MLNVVFVFAWLLLISGALLIYGNGPGCGGVGITCQAPRKLVQIL